MNYNTFNLFSTFGLVGLSVAPAMYASATQKVSVEVPFAFTAGSRMLPAGSYTFTGSGSSTLRIVCQNGRQNTLTVLSNAARTNKASEETKVVFHRYGDQYFLKSVWIRGEEDGTELVRSRMERHLARHSARPDILMLAGHVR